MTIVQHVSDGQCTVDPATGACTGCGADHSGKCEHCGATAFHEPGCKNLACEECGAQPSEECGPDCTAATSAANAVADAHGDPTPEVYVVFAGTAYAISPSQAPSAAYLLCTPVDIDGSPDVDNWGPPMYEALSDETNAALAQVEAALHALVKALPAEVPAS